MNATHFLIRVILIQFSSGNISPSIQGGKLLFASCRVFPVRSTAAIMHHCVLLNARTKYMTGVGMGDQAWAVKLEIKLGLKLGPGSPSGQTWEA